MQFKDENNNTRVATIATNWSTLLINNIYHKYIYLHEFISNVLALATLHVIHSFHFTLAAAAHADCSSGVRMHIYVCVQCIVFS